MISHEQSFTLSVQSCTLVMITVLEMFFDRNNYQKDIIKTTYWRSVKLKVVVCHYVNYVHQLPVQHVQVHLYACW